MLMVLAEQLAIAIFFTETCDQASYNGPANPDWMGPGWYRFVDTAGKTTFSLY